MLIGITGQIGSGKTTAAKIFKSFGAAVIDADRIGRDVVKSSPVLLKKLTWRFGNTILNRSGNLNRKRLAQLAFANRQSQTALNRIVHPYLLKELRHQERKLRRSYELLVIDAALLLDWNLDREVDFVLVVHASEQTRIRRLRSRGIGLADARARQAAQVPFSEYRRRADRVILNNRTPAVLRRKLKSLYAQLTAIC